MDKQILIGSYGVPYHGGASTSAYKLFEIMQNDGFDVSFVNIISEEEADYYRYVFNKKIGNPKCLKNLYNCFLKTPLFYPGPEHPELADIINHIAPDIMIGINFIAALLMKKSSPQIRSIFLTAGCDQVKHYVSRKKVYDLIHLQRFLPKAKGMPVIFSKREKEAVEISDLIMTHSETNKFFYEYFFPFQMGKIYADIIWFAEWIYKDALTYAGFKKTFVERDIDVLFIANRWDRQEKNYPLVKKIISRCKDLEIHIVGEVEETLSFARYDGLITNREEVFRLLGRSKTLVCPSLFDAAPGILFEASAMGCNIVASKNCGNWRICHKELLVDPFHLQGFLEKIRLALSQNYQDNIDYFLSPSSYDNLIETISVF